MNPARLLILCTGNSARSILAEAIVNRLGEDRFVCFSAGSRPTGRVNPAAAALLQRHGYDVSGLRSKSWDEFAGQDAPVIDYVFTVCDSAASETCPIWPGHPMVIHWGIADPAAVEGSEAEIRAAFEQAYETLLALFTRFISLDLESASLEEQKRALNKIAEQIENRRFPDE